MQGAGSSSDTTHVLALIRSPALFEYKAVFHHPILMCILNYFMINELWKCQISLNSHQKKLRSLEVVFDLCEKGLIWIMEDGNAFCIYIPPSASTTLCSCGSVIEQCVSSAKVVGSIPREHTYWQKCITWMYWSRFG